MRLMVKAELDQIILAEEEAQNLVKDAHGKAVIAVELAKKKAEAELAEAENLSRLDGEDLIEQAQKEAEQKAREIIKQAELDSQALRKNITPKITEARKLWR